MRPDFDRSLGSHLFRTIAALFLLALAFLALNFFPSSRILTCDRDTGYCYSRLAPLFTSEIVVETPISNIEDVRVIGSAFGHMGSECSLELDLKHRSVPVKVFDVKYCSKEVSSQLARDHADFIAFVRGDSSERHFERSMGPELFVKVVSGSMTFGFGFVSFYLLFTIWRSRRKH